MTISPQPVPKARKKFPIWLILVLVGATLSTLCIGALVVFMGLNALGSFAPAVFTASDNQSRVTAPGNWKDLPELHDDAELHIGDDSDEVYLIVLTESREDLGEMPLDEYTDLVTASFSETIENAVFSEPRTMTINGMDAIQLDITGTVDDLDVVYTLTGVAGDANYFQLVGWTLADRIERNREVIEGTIATFEQMP